MVKERFIGVYWKILRMHIVPPLFLERREQRWHFQWREKNKNDFIELMTKVCRLSA